MSTYAVTVHVPVSQHSMPYFEYLCKNYESLKSGIFDIEYTPHTVIGSGSGGHATAIESILKIPRQDDLELVRVIADSDTVMLKRGWDLRLVAETYKFDVIGTTYEDIGGFSSGSGNVQTYKGAPNLTWFAMAMHHDFSGLQCQPQKQSTLLIEDEHMSALYNLPIGHALLRDVGWQIPEYLASHDRTWLAMFHVKPTNGALAIQTGNDYHEEYHITRGEPFVAHQRGSMKHPFRGNEISSKFYDAVERYLGSK